jgi:hypothetical protein
MSAKAEKSPLLEAITRTRQVEIMQAGEELSLAAVICKVWRLAMALQLSVVMSYMYKCSVNPFTNPNPVYSHIYYVTIYSDVLSADINLLPAHCPSQHTTIFVRHLNLSKSAKRDNLPQALIALLLRYKNYILHIVT